MKKRIIQTLMLMIAFTSTFYAQTELHIENEDNATDIFMENLLNNAGLHLRVDDASNTWLTNFDNFLSRGTNNNGGFYLGAENGFSINTGDGGATCCGVVRFSIEPSGEIKTHGNLELGAYETGDRSTFIDFHSDDVNNDFSARILRFPSPNGNLLIQNIGNGDMQFFNAGKEVLTIKDQTGIRVNGNVVAKEVEVTLNGFPDYVFESDYDLMTLSEVDEFIQENGHLPNIPSAAEVASNGLGLGEFNKMLLEKVEELTLHLIAKEKQLVTVQNEFDAYKSNVESRLTDIEELLRLKNENNASNEK